MNQKLYKLTVAHAETYAIVDTDFIEKENPAYFSAAKQRNKARRKFLENEELQQKLADKIDQYLQLRQELQELVQELPDKYSILDRFDIHNI